MNATFLILSSAWLAGADAAPAAPAAPVPVVMSAAGCGGCDAPVASCDTGCSTSCGPRMGLFSRIKAKFSCTKHSRCAPACAAPVAAPCAPAPVACAPACGTPLIGHSLFTGFTTCGSGCGSSKLGLFDRLKSKFKHSGSCSSGCDNGCGSAEVSSGCSTGPAMVAPAYPPVPPKEMPAPPKVDPKPKTSASAPDTLRIPEFGSTAGKY